MRQNRGGRRDSRSDRQGSAGSFGSNNFGFRSGPREMHKATCSECGIECEVPFKPTEGKPVYCRECFRKRRSF